MKPSRPNCDEIVAALAKHYGVTVEGLDFRADTAAPPG